MFSNLYMTISRGVSIEYYPYRTVQPRDIIAIIDTQKEDRRNRDYINKILDLLFKKANAAKDNHVGFKVTFESGQSICLYWSDWRLYICLRFDRNDI